MLARIAGVFHEMSLGLQVHRLAENFTQSFMDYQRLSKLVPESLKVFEQLQQAAHLCLGSQHNMRQVHHGDVFQLACPICLPTLVAVAGRQGKNSFDL